MGSVDCDARRLHERFFALRRNEGAAFFALFAECLDRIDAGETLLGSPVPNFDLPFFLVDQDIANAVLWSEPFCSYASVLPYRSAPHAPFHGVRTASGLSCVDDTGDQPFFLHHALQKPWLEPLPSNPYSELLSEFLTHPLSPSLDYDELPLFLRPGRVAHAVRRVRSVRGRVRSHTRGKLGLRAYFEARARHLMLL